MSDQRYRVLFIASHPVPYQAPVFRQLASEPELDIQVAYCTLKGAEVAHDPEFDAKIQWDIPLLDGYAWSLVTNYGTGKESFFGLFNPGLGKLIYNGNYDALVCHVGYVRASFWVACLAAKFSNTAFLFGCDQGSLVPRDGRSWKQYLKRVGWPLLYRIADHVVVSSTRARQLIESLGIRKDHISLTPLVVDNAWWTAKSAEADRRTVRASWRATETDVVFLFSAKLQPWKRPLDLLYAFAKANLQNTHLVFAGEGPLRQELEIKAAELGVSERVHVLGFVNQSQLPAVYTAADLLVLPSEFEPFGVVVNEAMCCGCAVAASDRCGAATDLVAPVSSNLVFRPGDVDSLARILRDIASNPARLQILSQAAREQIQAWSPERNIATTIDAIRIAAVRKRQGTAEALAIATGCPASSKTPDPKK